MERDRNTQEKEFQGSRTAQRKPRDRNQEAFRKRSETHCCRVKDAFGNQVGISPQRTSKSLAEKYGLHEFLSKHPSELSGGMRQRVALIRTLALKPELLLLDEPFSALDYQTRLELCDHIFSIIKQEKKTAILVTHDIYEAISMSDRIIVLTARPGKIKAIHKTTTCS